MNLVLIRYLTIGLTVCALWSHVAKSAVVDNLYEASVAIPNQSDLAQRRAVRKALEQVLVKVSGTQALLSDDSIKQALNNASQLVRAYRFEVNNGQLVYSADFDRQFVQRTIQQAGFPLWGSRRPDSLLWLAVEQAGTNQRRLINEEMDAALITEIKQVATQRGIPLALPLLDLTDRQTVTVFDVWGRFNQVVKRASERYTPDFSVSARVYFDEGVPHLPDTDVVTQTDTENTSDDAVPATTATGSLLNDILSTDSSTQQQPSEPMWRLDWSIIGSKSTVSGQLQGDTQQAVVIAMVNMLADYLAAEFAIDTKQTNTQTPLQITVANIRSLPEYVSAQSVLESLGVVFSSRLVEQRGDTATFELRLLGSEQDLLNSLQLEDRIVPVKDQFGRDLSGMQYRWVNR